MTYRIKSAIFNLAKKTEMGQIMNKYALIYFLATSWTAILYAKTPSIFAYEQILKEDMKKHDVAFKVPAAMSNVNTGAKTLLSLPPLVPQSSAPQSSAPQTEEDFAYSASGVMSIDGKNSAWLINKNNKIIRITTGAIVDGKEIKSITEFGIFYHSEHGTKGFMPITTSVVSEKEVQLETSQSKVKNSTIGQP